MFTTARFGPVQDGHATLASMTEHDPCPCGRGEPYTRCCGPLHAGLAAPTAERLMRSRYSAFVRRHVDYLLETWHPDTRPDSLVLDADISWKRLLIESTDQGGPFDDAGAVTFTAIGLTTTATGGTERFEQRERSRFLRFGPERRWVYLDGEVTG